MKFEIRRPHMHEHDRIHQLVWTVVNETYGGQWTTAPLQVDEEDWAAGWVAATASDLLGWMLTRDDWIGDLWILPQFRRQGVGSALLAHGEMEIAKRGFAKANLHVVASNARAIGFYMRNGWQQVREVPHERLPIMMVDMAKPLG
jgi:ribosomal protein S18 acetylase RimI-like enzyme